MAEVFFDGLPETLEILEMESPGQDPVKALSGRTIGLARLDYGGTFFLMLSDGHICHFENRLVKIMNIEILSSRQGFIDFLNQIPGFEKMIPGRPGKIVAIED